MTRRTALWIAIATVAWMYSLAACASQDNDPDTQDRHMSVDIDPTSTGTGSVTSQDGGIDCEPLCDFDYDIHSVVHLSANPNIGSLFDTWSGDCFGDIRQVSVLLNGDRHCIARFEKGAGIILIQNPGTGTGKVTGDSAISCGGGDTTCSATVAVGDSLSLTAEPDSGSVFAGWGGDCAQFGANLNIKPKLDLDLACSFQFDEEPPAGSVLTPRGSFTFDHRIEVGVLRVNTVYTAGFDGPPQGHTVDFTDPDNPTSATGAEYSPCFGARGFTSFFSPLPQYLGEVIHATCVGSRQGSLTPASLGLTQLEFYNFAAADVEPVPNTELEAVADFEFGRVRFFDRGISPNPDILLDLTNPLQKTCPFSMVIDDSTLYVAGREGVVGTSTANCENWHGLWRVNLNTWAVDGFTPFGTKLRDLGYYNEMVYVTDFDEDKVHVINGTTGAYDHFINVGDGPTAVVVEDRAGALSDRLYVTNWNTNLVKVFDLGTEQELDSQPSGGVAPVTLMRNGNLLVVLNFGDAANSIGAVLKAFTIQ